MQGSRGAQKGSNPQNSFDVIYPGSSQAVAIESSSNACANSFAAGVSIVRLYATQDCFIKLGSSPTAGTDGMFLPGGIVEYVGVSPGDKIAVIQESMSGTLYITEGSP